MSILTKYCIHAIFQCISYTFLHFIHTYDIYLHFSFGFVDVLEHWKMFLELFLFEHIGHLGNVDLSIYKSTEARD